MNPPQHLSEESQLFLRDKQAWENAIAAYNGSDPLELWYNYISWFDYNVHIDPENKFRETLEKCLALYEYNEFYKQDIRIVKLWVKYIDLQPNPLNLYQILYQRGIGTQCACFYIGWAHYYDSANAFKQAESVYNLGFQANAQPYADLQEAHTKFRLSVSHRMLYNDSSSKKRSASNLNEQRQQITTLNPPPKKMISEVTEFVDSTQQTTVQSQHPNEVQLEHNNVYQHNGQPTNVDQYDLNNSAYVISSSLNYIYGENQATAQEDSTSKQEYILENVKVPENFPTFCKNNYETWRPSLFLDEPYDPNKKCIYQKNLIYPVEGNEYSPEEIRARKYVKKVKENINLIESIGNGNINNSSYKHKIDLAKSGSECEEQIEASTIRFCTDSNGSTKNKTITIKFRREKPASTESSQNKSVKYNASLDKSSSFTYTVEEVPRSQKHKHDQHRFDIPEKTKNNFTEHFSSSPNSTLSRHSLSAPKPKKIKKIKIINNYDDPKYTAGCSSNSNSSIDYYNQSHKAKNSSSLSRNEYEDANLLLSFANVSSADSNTYVNGSRVENDSFAFNEDSLSNAELNSTFTENSYLPASNCSTPVRKLSQSYSKTSTPQTYRSLKKHTSNLSIQNDDSLCSYEQNSFFASEYDEELKSKRLEKALSTINTHLTKPAIDPFSTELCKAFLTKLDFPSRDKNAVYKVVNNPIPKLANTRAATLGDATYHIEKEVGRGSYGSVYKAVHSYTGSVVALKFQKPPNTWELYICLQVKQRIKNYDILPGFMDISSAIIAPNASILITEFSVYGSLLDINNKLRQATKKVMHESLVMHFSSQILNIVNHLHSCKIIHADIKPDNFLLMRVPNSDSHIPSLRLIDFGCAIDMTLFPEKTQFKKVIQTDGFTCIEMQEGRIWSYQTDLFCIAGTIHVMLFGEYMQLVKKFDSWDIKQKLPRYLKKHIWTEFFSKMLNIRDSDNLPDLVEMKSLLDSELCKMESELQTQIRTLSNLLHRR